jgi:DNA-binding NtrC family response regulator
LRFADSTMGLLAIESQRRRDFVRLDLARHEELLSTHALALELAAFREFQRSRHRAEPCFDVHAAGFRRFAERLMRAARRGQCITLCGALGSGRKTLARWVHWLSPARDAELGVQGPESEFEAGALQNLLERHAGSTLLFTELERWPLSAQRQVLEWLQEHEGNPRANAPHPIVVMGLSPAQAESKGLLEPALARRLERLCWRLPSLHERRGEILTLFAAVTESLARREQLRVPQWEDDALALLWRQRWQGNLTELESVALRCLLFAPGRRIDAELLARLLREFGIRPLERLPSRRPDRADLLAALSITRLGTGRVNKTRAALYLGWDPDTLVARMQDLDIPEEGPFEVLSWGGLDFPVESSAAALPHDGAA